MLERSGLCFGNCGDILCLIYRSSEEQAQASQEGWLPGIKAYYFGTRANRKKK